MVIDDLVRWLGIFGNMTSVPGSYMKYKNISIRRLLDKENTYDTSGGRVEFSLPLQQPQEYPELSVVHLHLVLVGVEHPLQVERLRRQMEVRTGLTLP